MWRAPLEGTRHRGLLLAAHAPLVSSVPRALVLVLPVRQGLSRLKLVLDNAHLVPRVLSSKALAELNASVARQASAPEPDPPFARCALLVSINHNEEEFVRTAPLAPSAPRQVLRLATAAMSDYFSQALGLPCVRSAPMALFPKLLALPHVVFALQAHTLPVGV